MKTLKTFEQFDNRTEPTKIKNKKVINDIINKLDNHEVYGKDLYFMTQGYHSANEKSITKYLNKRLAEFYNLTDWEKQEIIDHYIGQYLKNINMDPEIPEGTMGYLDPNM